ncbi:hypothetical protein [Rhizobium sp. 60-20]|uniref:hypothetical protein n=1 Tax=Rhizobium sp. 60-20 TaxID=1895819 RepID=UPI00092BCFB1|nr:hypothetical protein [Rhizobium sp. 60-20]MBN8950875.1 hypothetical protein [Rhizobium tropici]OJY66392.1 MAG: hypothetical protein BGP09_31165 [Rhizobium sp. 60-20]
MSAIPDEIMQAAMAVYDAAAADGFRSGSVKLIAQVILSERQRTADLIEEVKRVLEPFNQMAGELFSRNWNASDLVLALDNPGQENRLTAGDIFAVRALLSKLEVRS